MGFENLAAERAALRLPHCMLWVGVLLAELKEPGELNLTSAGRFV